MKTVYNNLNITKHRDEYKYSLEDNTFDRMFEYTTDEDVSSFFNVNYLDFLYIEKYDGFFYKKNGNHVIYYVNNLLQNVKNRYISTASLEFCQEQQLRYTYNEYQPSNTVFVGNVSFKQLYYYYSDNPASLYNSYSEIIVGAIAYDIHHKELKHTFPVFVDVDIIKEKLNKINSNLRSDSKLLDFDRLYVTLD